LVTSRLLIIGAYRPEAISPIKNGETHPLASVINELQRQFGDIQIDMDQGDGLDFINALVDNEPTKLNSNFRRALYKQTAGNPLLTVELLRSLQKQGHINRDQTGCWVDGGKLDWTKMPPRIEGFLAERLSQLTPSCQAILNAASVQGQIFIAEIVAQVLNYDPDIVIHILSDSVIKEHHLMKVERVEYINGQRLSYYQFRHTLLQQYLYQELDEAKRHLLHRATGTALESIYSESTRDHAIELAGHFQAAGFVEKADDYLLLAGKSVHLQ
jgi:predicted ATPase